MLNRTSPFSIWINGEKLDVLEQEGQRQNAELRNLEEKYTEMADSVDSILEDSMKVMFTCGWDRSTPPSHQTYLAAKGERNAQVV